MLNNNGIFGMFTWKNKETREKEQDEYAKWAFPYGEKQKKSLIALLLSIFPKETASTTLVPFLTCKELYETALKKSESIDDAVSAMINTKMRYKSIIGKKDMSTYLALVLADENIDERCEYPSAEEIRKKAAELEKLLTTDK